MASEKPFFNDHQGLYHRRHPALYNTEMIAGLSYLEKNAEIIRDELFQVLADPRLAELSFKKYSLKKQQGWSQIELRIYGVNYPQRLALFPETMKVLDQIPDISTIYFSALSPHTTIAPHTGDTDAFYRVHLGLEIPEKLPNCGFEVAGQQVEWQEGKCFAFNDMYYHTAWNHTEKERIVLILDILRPEFRDQKTWVNTGVRATLYHSRLYERLFFVFELLPRLLTRLIRPAFHWTAYFWYRLRN